MNNWTLFFGVVGVLVFLYLYLSPCRESSDQPLVSVPCVTHQWNEDYSYLYYIGKDGKLVYDYEFCRGCIENEAERLRSRGFVVTEVCLGRKWSSDL